MSAQDWTIRETTRHEDHLYSLDRRITSVEKALTALDTSHQSLHTDLRDVKASISRLGENVTSRSQTNWSVLVGFGTLIAVVVGGYTTLNLAPLNEKVELLSEAKSYRITLLDQNLQREMRDLDATSAARIDNLDVVLQREMRLLDDAAAVEKDYLRDQLSDIRERLDDVEKRVDWSE